VRIQCDRCDATTKYLESEIAENAKLRELLREAAEKLDLVDNAFTKNWAVDWNEVTEMSNKIKAALGEK
jgi:hypothetical protein